jgi:hypothetical protein
VIGSWAPDLPYYLPISPEASHTLVGLFIEDIPLALALFVVWQGFLGRQVVALLPPAASRRLAGYPSGLRGTAGTVGRLLLVLAAMVLGGLTHLFWDLFTHDHGWIYDHVAWSREMHGPLRGVRWVHAFSELIAWTTFAVVGVRWWRRTQSPAVATSSGPGLAAWAAYALVLVATVAGAAYGLKLEPTNRLFNILTHGIAWGSLALLVVGTARWLTTRARLAT